MALAALLVLRQKRQESAVSCRGQIRWDDLQHVLPDCRVYLCESVCCFTSEKDSLTPVERHTAAHSVPRMVSEYVVGEKSPYLLTTVCTESGADSQLIS